MSVKPRFLFVCSHLTTFLERNLKANLQLFWLLQMSMIMIFVTISQFGKRLANACTVPVHDVPNGVCLHFSHVFSCLGFLWQHDIPSQHYCWVLSHGMLFFSYEASMLSTSNNWNLFSNFSIYWLWGDLWKYITSSRIL